MQPQVKTETKENSTVPYRGDIIVDSCVLFDMCSEIPSSNVVKKHYIELLPFLARNGYNVIIPEMVSYETGQILSSGADIEKFFLGPKSDLIYNILKPILKDASLKQGSLHKENLNINIAVNTGPDYVNNFCREMERITDEHTKRTGELRSLTANGRGKSVKSIRNIANNETHIGINRLNNARKANKMDYGDESIVSLIEKKVKSPQGHPVFVLTDDANLRNRIKGIAGVESVTMSGLIYSIVNSGLGKECGFPSDMQAVDLERNRRESQARIMPGIRVIGEQLHLNEEEYVQSVKSHPFFKTIEKLADDLKGNPDKEVQETAISNGGESRVAKFMAKYAKREQSMGDSPMR